MFTMEAEKVNESRKRCIDCHTISTPLWRGGPAGPRTLCNACGIRYRKQRRALMSFDKGGESKSSKMKSSKRSRNKLGVSTLKVGLMAWGREMGEDEEAAMLLMALSCGS